jgi:4-hydroxy-3-methylbut-2-enyl diphosphate reductase
MKVIKAKSAGFCFGVSNAVNTALNAARDNTGGGNLYTLGELIHNPSVVADLEKRGYSWRIRWKKSKLDL